VVGRTAQRLPAQQLKDDVRPAVLYLESRAKHSGSLVYPIIRILYEAVYLPHKALASKLRQGKKAQNKKSVHGSLSLGNTGGRARP